MTKSFTSFAALKTALDTEQRAERQADIDAAKRLRRSAPLRAANGRKPGTGPAIAKTR